METIDEPDQFLDMSVMTLPWGRLALQLSVPDAETWIQRLGSGQALHAMWNGKFETPNIVLGPSQNLCFFGYTPPPAGGKGTSLQLGTTDTFISDARTLWQILAVHAVADCWLVSTSPDARTPIAHLLLCTGNAPGVEQVLLDLHGAHHEGGASPGRGDPRTEDTQWQGAARAKKSSSTPFQV